MPDLTSTKGIDLTGLYSALESLHRTMTFSSRDWGRGRGDAWPYGIAVGWDGDPDEPGDEDSWALIAERFRMDAATLARLKALRGSVRTLTPDAIADAARKAKALAEYEHAISWETTCPVCARGLDTAYGETMRAETAEAEAALMGRQIADLLARCTAAEQSGADTIPLAEVYASLITDPAEEPAGGES